MKDKFLNLIEMEGDCPVDYAFKRIGGKYKGRILWFLSECYVLRYGELKKLLREVTTKMLTQTLKELQQDGLINRKLYHEVPPKVEYRLTDTGKELIPFIAHLHKWGMQQLSKEKPVRRKRKSVTD